MLHHTRRNHVDAKRCLLRFVFVIGLLCLSYGVCVARGIRVSEETAALVRSKEGQRPSATAVFALGSFWRGEAVFGCLPGVLKTRVGYCGGTKLIPDYRNIGDHAECVEVEYDSSTIRYEQLLDVFWSNHDPTQSFGQGPDVGEQYRSVILTQSEDETVLATLSKEREQIKLGPWAAVTTKVQPLSAFYPAEADHQKFELKRKITLLQLLGDWSEAELVTSTTAAKLNSYAAGFCEKPVRKLIDSKVSPLLKSRPQLLQIFGS
ncbi:unnamed protein product [Calypogeia fissa]